MKQECTYSIIIPHYNNMPLLDRLLRSVPKRDDIQIIIVDDCSSNEQRAMLKKISRSNVFVNFNDEKTSAGNVRNQGLSLAQGKWILFADADDFYNEDAFSVLDRYVDRDLDCVCFCVNSFDNEKKNSGGREILSDKSVRSFLYSRNPFTEKLVKFKNYACWNKMYAKSFLDSNHIFFEDARVNNDVFFSLQVGAYAKKFEVIANELYCCTYSSNSITFQQRTIEREFEFYKMAKKRNGFYRKIKLGKGFIRYDLIYLPYMIKKRGLIGAFRFYRYAWEHRKELKQSEKAYIPLAKKMMNKL